MARTVSVAFSSYNQVAFVRPALRSVLTQEHDPLQVVVFDDGSDDGTQAAIREELDGYDGPHDVIVELRDHNDPDTALQGCLDRCDGDWVVRAHGDDLSRPDRVARVVAEGERLGVSMVTSNAVLIDEEGNALRYWRDPDGTYDCSLETFARVGFIDAELGAGLSFDRRVWTEFGPRRKGPRNSDGVLTLRAALLDGVHLDPEPTLLYRRRLGQTAIWALLEDADDDDERRAIHERHMQNRVANAVVYVDLVQEHLERHPDDVGARRALPGFLDHLLRTAREFSHLRVDMVRDGHGLF